ncbi:MAG: hypothetical protein QOK22_164 [Gaiellaceae bacterium]|nr:hypothetical protein [Gaiellaceae bacterium]
MGLLLASLALGSILAGCGGNEKAAPRSDSVGWAPLDSRNGVGVLLQSARSPAAHGESKR